MRPEYGETWVYESIVGAVPGIELGRRQAIAVQLLGFEAAVLLLAWYYDLWSAALAGTAAVVVAAGGSVEMLRLGRRARAAETPDAYRRALFGSSVEVVLGVLAFIALLTYLFVYDPRTGTPLVEELLGPDPPLPAAYLVLLVLWDLCYRIGTGWWAAVVAFWRSARYRFDPATAASLKRVDGETVLFGFLQLLLAPFLLGHPVLLAALVGHVVAVAVVGGTSILLLRSRNGA